MTKSELLSTPSEVERLAARLSQHEIIAFDTEFIRESTFYPIVEIIQVATESESWIVDAAAFKKGFAAGPRGGFHAGLQPLFDVFQDPKILKIVHAAQGDQECLFTSFGVLAKPTLDTAVAASLCGYGDAIGLGRLLKAVLDVSLKKGHARTNWSVRPLPEQLIEYALSDVEHLVPLARKLLEQLDALGRRPWAFELTSKWEDPSLYEPEIEQIVQKLARGGRLDNKGYAALVELVRWRENRVRQINVPRRWVADDAVLVDLAQVRPRDLAHLSAFRGLNKGELKISGEAILSALNRASEQKDLKAPRVPRPDLPTNEEQQVLDLLRVYLGVLADEHRIASRYLSTPAQLLPLLRRDFGSAAELVAEGTLSGEAGRLIGEELLAFVRGRRALTVENARLKVVKTEEEKETNACR